MLGKKAKIKTEKRIWIFWNNCSKQWAIVCTNSSVINQSESICINPYHQNLFDHFWSDISFVNRYRYFIYSIGCEMRKGYDGLWGLVINAFKMSPLSGDVVVFLSKPRNKIKLLHWQGDGFVIYSKRLEKGNFELPKINSTPASIEIPSNQLQFILSGIFL